MTIKTLNTQEDIPEFFYIFTNRHPRKFVNQVEQHNINLRNGILVSAGFNNVFTKKTRKKFLEGDLDYLPYVKGKPSTIGTCSPFLMRVTERYTLEYNLEVFRKSYYKTYPSRLSGIFAFGSMEACEEVAKSNKNDWKLDDVKKYKLADFNELNQYVKVIKSNHKLIGLLENLGITAIITEDQTRLYDHYWQGRGGLSSNEIAIADDIVLPSKRCGFIEEYLIEGILEEVED